jgi:hypothetical protein
MATLNGKLYMSCMRLSWYIVGPKAFMTPLSSYKCKAGLSLDRDEPLPV